MKLIKIATYLFLALLTFKNVLASNKYLIQLSGASRNLSIEAWDNSFNRGSSNRIEAAKLRGDIQSECYKVSFNYFDCPYEQSAQKYEASINFYFLESEVKSLSDHESHYPVRVDIHLISNVTLSANEKLSGRTLYLQNVCNRSMNLRNV